MLKKGPAGDDASARRGGNVCKHVQRAVHFPSDCKARRDYLPLHAGAALCLCLCSFVQVEPAFRGARRCVWKCATARQTRLDPGASDRPPPHTLLPSPPCRPGTALHAGALPGHSRSTGKQPETNEGGLSRILLALRPQLKSNVRSERPGGCIVQKVNRNKPKQTRISDFVLRQFVALSVF